MTKYQKGAWATLPLCVLLFVKGTISIFSDTPIPEPFFQGIILLTLGTMMLRLFKY